MKLPEVELLTADDEVDLARTIEVGLVAEYRLALNPDPRDRNLLRHVVAEGKAAVEQMWLANLRLVAWVANPLAARYSLPADELFQAGCEGLGESIWRWDYRRGYRFSTYAHPLIRASVTRAVRTRCGQRSDSLGRVLSRLHRSDQQGSSTATIQDLAQRAGCSVQTAFEALRYREVAFDSVVQPPKTSIDAGTSREFCEWLEQLTTVQRHVIALRYGPSAHSQHQVSKILHTSPSSVSRIEQSALVALRKLVA